MKMETAKTFFLIVLIGISLLLTFGIWSYQPDLKELSDNPTLNEAVDIGGKGEEKKQTVIEPREVVFRVDDRYYGFSDPKQRNEFYKELQSWPITNFQTDLVNERTPNKYEVEIIFPSQLPMEILSPLFNLSESNIELPTWSFERMYLTFNADTKSLNVEILSIDGRNEATAVINDSSYYDSLWEYFQTDDKALLQEYLAVELAGKSVYIPMGAKKLNKQSFTFDLIDVPNQLIDVLFPDPSRVSQTYSFDNGETYYNDSQRGMSVYGDNSRMKFVDPSSEDSIGDVQTTADILTNSISQINSHFGWTGEYYLMDINGQDNFVRYQMYNDGYPVYNVLNLSYIDQKWINQQLNEYFRPLFRLNEPLIGNKVELMSGKELIAYLKKNRNYNLENIQDIRIGYRLNYHYNEESPGENSTDNRYIELIPGWFKLENGEWNEFNLTEENLLKGGD